MFRVLQPGDPATSPPPAGRVRRGGAVLLDVLIFAIFYSTIIFVWGSKVSDRSWTLKGPPACGTMLLFPVYWLLMEKLYSGTLGKRFLGLRVFSLAGPELEWNQVLKRNVGKIFEAPILWLFSIGFSFTNPLRQTPGDVWAKTLVTEDRLLSEWRYGPGDQDFGNWLASFKKPQPGDTAVPPPETPAG